MFQKENPNVTELSTHPNWCQTAAMGITSYSHTQVFDMMPASATLAWSPAITKSVRECNEWESFDLMNPAAGAPEKCYPEDPTGPDEIHPDAAAYWPKASIQPFHYPHPVTDKLWKASSGP
jgi:hypothetical protein